MHLRGGTSVHSTALACAIEWNYESPDHHSAAVPSLPVAGCLVTLSQLGASMHFSWIH